MGTGSVHKVGSEHSPSSGAPGNSETSGSSSPSSLTSRGGRGVENLWSGQARSATCCSSKMPVAARTEPGLAPEGLSHPAPHPPAPALLGAHRGARSPALQPLGSTQSPSPGLPCTRASMSGSPCTGHHHSNGGGSLSTRPRPTWPPWGAFLTPSAPWTSPIHALPTLLPASTSVSPEVGAPQRPLQGPSRANCVAGTALRNAGRLYSHLTRDTKAQRCEDTCSRSHRW